MEATRDPRKAKSKSQPRDDLRTIRKSKKITMGEMAKRTHLSWSTISRIEKGLSTRPALVEWYVKMLAL